MPTAVNPGPTDHPARPIVAVLAAATLWGTTGTAQALGPEDSTPLAVGALRLALGGLTLALVAWATGNLRHQPWRATLAPLGLGGVAVALYQLGFFVGTSRAGVAVATVVTIGSAPVFSILLSLGRGRGAPDRATWWATSLTILGVVLLGLAGGGGGGLTPDVAGVVAALIAGAGYATYAELGREAMDRGMHSTTSMAGLFCVGAALASLTLPWQPLGWVHTGSGVLMLGHLSLVTLGLAYVLYGWGLGRLPVATVVTLTLAEPLVASLLAVVVLDERLGPLGWIGVSAVVAGLLLVGRAAQRPRVPSAAHPLPSPP